MTANGQKNRLPIMEIKQNLFANALRDKHNALEKTHSMNAKAERAGVKARAEGLGGGQAVTSFLASCLVCLACSFWIAIPAPYIGSPPLSSSRLIRPCVNPLALAISDCVTPESINSLIRDCQFIPQYYFSDISKSIPK